SIFDRTLIASRENRSTNGIISAIGHAANVGIRGARNLVITHYAPTQSQFEIIYHRRNAFHEVFFRHSPTHREGGKISPALAGTKRRGTVGPEVGSQQVFFIKIICDPSEEGGIRLF